MSKNSNIRPEDITADDILSLHNDVLPLLYANPGNLSPVTQLKKGISRFVQFDSFHYMMQDPKPALPTERMQGVFEHYPAEDEKWELSVRDLTRKNSGELFAELCERGRQKMIEAARAEDPRKPQFVYHRILSDEYPKLMLGFFRFGKVGEEKAFTKDEISIFEKLTPHVLVLFRIVLSPMFNSPSFEYFDTFISICSAIAHDHALSDTELKFLPEILFGRTNEEMAEKYFISLATVKKHIQHIFKKTGCKSRIDFISKFFTSPDHIKL